MAFRKLVVTAVLATFGFSGCGLIMDVTGANDAVVNAEDQMAQNMAAGMTAPMYRSYALSLMAAYFWAGGYWLAWHPYQPGEWTKWSHEIKSAEDNDQQQPLFVEKAFLKRTEDGGEWWRLKAFQEEEKDTFVFEALFSPDKTHIVKLRAKMGENPVEEVVFEEGENAFPAPSQFKDNWIKEHRVGSIEMALGSVKVSADHIRYTAPNGTGQVDFFFSDDVPGGLVKYQFSSQKGDSYTVQLVDHGTGATTELGSF